MEIDAEDDIYRYQKTYKKYKCSFEGCSLVFLKPSTLKWHINVHLNERPFKCTFEGCDKSYSSPSHLKRHVQNHQDVIKPKYQCKYCAGFFSNTTNLKRHIKRIHSDNAKICEQCNKKFRKQNLYEEHMIKFHNLLADQLQSYECGQCGKILETLTGYHKHKKRHLTKLFQCPVKNCSAEFYTLKLLAEHGRNTHVFQYTCAHCDKIFYYKNNLKCHILTHFKRVTFTCTYKNCNRLYYFKKNLLQHVQTFHGGKKFKCNMCSTELSTRQKLDQHMNTKHKTKNKTVTFKYTCADCEKQFYCKTALRVHVATHLKKEERDKLPCPFKKCNRSYYHKKTLNEHIQKVHKE